MFFKSGSLFECAPEAGFVCKPCAGNVKSPPSASPVTNTALGTDPHPNVVRTKILRVTYCVGGQGQRQTKVYGGQEPTRP